MLEVLIFMFNHYVDKRAILHQEQFERDEIAKELSQAGFEYDDILGAIDWYNDLRQLSTQPYAAYLNEPHSIRVYIESEIERIDAESFSFLNFLEQASVIKPNERDLIIDRALAISQEDITIEEIRWITMMVLWNDKRKKDYLFVEDAVFNPQGRTIQ